MPDTRSITNLQEQRSRKIRPYFVSIDPRDVVNWKISTGSDGKPILDWVVIKSVEFVSDSPFDDYQVQRSFKVWYRDKWEKYIFPTDATREQDAELIDEGINPLGIVPLVPVYSNQIRPMVSTPPLEEPADLNIQHYNMYSMLINGMMYHLNPMLTIKGMATDEEARKSADWALFLPERGDAKYVEFTGQSMSVAKEAIDQMSIEVMESGLRNTSFLGANTSADARRLARSDFNSFLMDIANSVEIGYNEALRIAALWLNHDLDTEEHRVNLNKDYDVVTMDSGSADFLLKARENGEIPRKLFLTELQRGELIDKSVDVDEVLEQAKSDGPSVRAVSAGASGIENSNRPRATGETQDDG